MTEAPLEVARALIGSHQWAKIRLNILWIRKASSTSFSMCDLRSPRPPDAGRSRCHHAPMNPSQCSGGYRTTPPIGGTKDAGLNADYLVVGRPVTEAADPKKVADA